MARQTRHNAWWKKAWWNKAIFFAIFAGMGFVLGGLIGRMAKGKLNLGADPLWLLATPLVLLAVLFWHEAGHALGGRLVGFRLHLLAAGPMRLDRTPQGWRLSFNRNLGLWGGVAASGPDADLAPGLAQPGLVQLPRRMLTMVAGGPVASLAGAVLALLLAWAMGPGPARLLAGVFGVFSFLIAIATAMPQSFGGFKSDGQRVLELLRGGADAQRWCALATLSALALKERPRDWPKEIVELSTRDSDDSYDGISALWLRHSWHLDRGEKAEAGEWLERALEVVECWPAAARPLIYSSATYFYAMESGDPIKAQRYLELARKSGFLPPEGKALAEAAAAVANGRSDEAKAAAQRGKALARHHAGGAGEAMREYFALIEARANH